MRLGDFVNLNPTIKLTKGIPYAFVEMKDLEPSIRSVFSNYNKEFSGSGSKFECGDTLLARITPCLENGKTSQFKGHSSPAWGSTEFIVLRSIPDKSDNDFIYYLSRSPEFRSYAIQNMVGSSGRQRVPNDAVKDYECEFPSLRDQKAIAHILGTLDDKIELNQKMNQTLEDIAKAIFKSWFVDFDPVRAKADGRPTGLPPEISDLFPDELVDSEIGEIPKGWEVAKLAEICETTDYVANGSFSALKENVSKVESFSGTEAMMLRFADFNKGWAGDFSFVTHDSYEFLSKSKVFCGDIVICNVGEVGAVLRAPDLGFDMTLGPNGVLCKNFESGIGLKREYFYFCLSEKTFRSRIEAISSGSVQTKFNKTEFRNLDVLIPHHQLLAVVDPVFEQVCQRLDLLFEENRILSELRDTLLPKLISGELRIPDAEKFLKEAGI